MLVEIFIEFLETSLKNFRTLQKKRLAMDIANNVRKAALQNNVLVS